MGKGFVKLTTSCDKNRHSHITDKRTKLSYSWRFNYHRRRKIKTEEDHAKGKPSSETLNKAKVKIRDAL